MLWQHSSSPVEGHQVPCWGETAQELGDWELLTHFWRENTSSQGGVLPWLQLHSQALAQRPALSIAGQPTTPMHGKNTLQLPAQGRPQACTAPSLPCHNMQAADSWV